MKTMKRGTITRGLILAALLLVIPMTVTAMGNSEQPYGIMLDEEFADIAEALEAGEIDLETAIDQLHELRTENSRSDNEDYQKMEGLLESVQTREMTATKAREQLRLLDESKTELSEVQLKERIRSRDQVKDQVQEEAQTQDSAGSKAQTSKPEASGSSNPDKPASSGSGEAGKN